MLDEMHINCLMKCINEMFCRIKFLAYKPFNEMHQCDVLLDKLFEVLIMCRNS